MRLIGIAAALIASTDLALSETLRCEIATKQQCTAEEGCRPAVLGVFNRIDPARQSYARCDRLGCDTYEANFNRSGAFVNIELPGRSVIAKMAVDGTQFVEVVTVGTIVVYVSFGSCKMER